MSVDLLPKINSAESISKYKKLLENNGILDKVAEIHEMDPSLKGQGGGSDRRYVTVKFENPNQPELNLFTKVVVAGNPDHMEIVRGLKAFEKEAAFFMKYLPAAKEFCKRKGLDGKIFMDMYPKCYYGDENMIVLENLVLQNYEILGMEERHDWNLAIIVLESMAKHHALSYAMIMESGGADKFFDQFVPLGHDGFCDPTLAAKMEGWFQSVFETNAKILEINSQMEGAPKAFEILQKLWKRKKCLTELWTSSLIKDKNADEFQLLNHGDMWYTNMMFLKNPVTGKFDTYKAFDFQMLRYNSPSFDLAYYLLTSVKTDVRQSRFQDLLQFYLTCLQKCSTQLGYPVEEQQLNYEILLLQYRKRFHYGLLISFMTQYGAAQKITKDVDTTKLDSAEVGNVMGKAIQKWFSEYPEEARKLTEEIISVLHEIDKLEM